MSDRLRLNRADLAKFLPDHKQIRQFESLFAQIAALPPSSIDDLTAAVAALSAQAGEALSSIDDLGTDLSSTLASIESRLSEIDDWDSEERGPTWQPPRLDRLEDVSSPVPADFNILQFDATTAQWIARAYLAGLRYGGSGADYSTFESDGTLRFEGAATVWRDIDFPIIIRGTGPNIPSLTTLQGNVTAPQWAVNDYNVCEAQEMIHSWKEESESQWHVHMVTNGLDTTDRWVNWEVEWFWGSFGTAISATTTTSTECLIPANTATKTHLIFEISRPTLTGGKIGAHVWARLRRIANTTPGRNAPTSNPWCSMLQMHVECDTVGSRTITAK